MKGELINMTPAWDKEKIWVPNRNRTHYHPNTWLLSMSSSSSVDRAPTMCSEDPGFDFCRGITLVSCWSIHLPVFRGTSCFLFFFRKVKIIEKTCQADPRSSVKSYTRTLLRFCRIRTCECPFYMYQQRSKAGKTHWDLNKNAAYKKSINQSITFNS